MLYEVITLTEVRALIEELRRILGSEEARRELLVGELREIADKYGDDRRTEITTAIGSFDVEDLIVEEDMVVTVSHTGYIKRNPLTQYRAQRRGGKGVKGMQAKDEDFVESLFVRNNFV